VKSYKILPLLALLCACGGDYKDPESSLSFGSQKLGVIGGSLSVTEAVIRGSGAVIFDSRHSGFQSAGSYALDFSLEEGGSLKVVSHAGDQLEGGFELEFRRSGSGPDSLRVSLRAQGSAWTATNQFAGIDAGQAIRLQADVHNGESPAHILVWSRAGGEDFSREKAVLNSAEEIDGSPGIGTGARWGLVLERASVTRAILSSPKFAH
jgi:hypothetical protein